MKNPNFDLILNNVMDSLRHACEHFEELTKHEQWHHEKWIILSVHHAASNLAMNILYETDEKNRLFTHKKSEKFQYPYLKKTITEITNCKDAIISKSTLELLNIFGRLNDVRNEVMHKTPPTNFNKDVISFAAISLISMIKVIARKKHSTFHNILNKISDANDIVFQAIHWTKHDEYFCFMESFIHEEYNWYDLGICPSCNINSINNNKCEICFEEVEEIICPECKEETLIISGYSFPQTCSKCKKVIPI